MRVLIRLCLVLGVLGLFAGQAMAHVGLRESSPARDAVLDRPPERIELTFSGDVSADFPVIEVVNEAGARVDRGDAARDRQNARLVAATLEPLTAGRYTVTWRVLAADGHSIRGTFGFSVKAGAEPAAPGDPAVPAEPAQPAPPVEEAWPEVLPAPGISFVILAGYWLLTGGLLALAGLGLSQLLVVRLTAGERYGRWAMAALWAALAGTALHLVGRTAEAAGVSLFEALSPVLWGKLLLAQTGWAILARLAVLLLGLGLAPWFVRRWGFGALVGAAGLLTISLGGHAVALERPLVTVSLDWLHLMAAALWTGGLLQFAVVLPGAVGPGDLGQMVRRFSPLALISVALLIITGAYPAALHIPSREALLQTDYGLTFRVKMLLMIPLLLLAAANLTQVGPRLRRGEPVAGWLRRIAGGEAAVMAAVLGAAVLLTSLPPAGLDLPVPVLDMGGHRQHYGYAVKVEPLSPGSRDLDLWLYPHDGEITAETRVLLELRGSGEGEQVKEGRYLGGEQFRFEALMITQSGDWELHVQVSGPGLEPETFRVYFTVP